MKEQVSGMELMLRSMGLGDVMDAAKALAKSGAVQKLMKFADDAEGIRNDIAEIKAHLGIVEPGDEQPAAESAPLLIAAPGSGAGDGSEAEPGAHTGDRRSA